jgi:hypothetical protein
MKKVVGIGLMAAALAFIGAPKAEAALAFSFHVCQGAICQDFASSAASGTVGDYSFSAIGGGINATPTSSSSTATINVQRVSTTVGTAPLDVWFTVTGYTLPQGPYAFDVSLGVTETGAQRDSVSYQAWFSSTNAVGFPPPGSVPSLVATCTPLNQNNQSDSCFQDPGPIPAGPSSALYSLVSQTRFNIGLTDLSTFGTAAQASLTGVPEPGSMVLLGTGLLGMAASLRRRFAKK